MVTLEDALNIHIPNRLKAIKRVPAVWDLLYESGQLPEVRVVIGEREDTSFSFTNIAVPMLEIGLIHARVLLEFLGLGFSEKKGGLIQIHERRNKGDDIGIEDYKAQGAPLMKVSPEDVRSAYQGPEDDAEKAFVAIFKLANKLVAHLTTDDLYQKFTDQHLDIACRGIPALIQTHLYTKLGRPLPV